MRGSQTLFTDVFKTAVPDLKAQRKGRSAQLHTLRNECLVSRYYYYGKFTDKRYLTILEMLSREFFISTVTIPEVLNANFGLLNTLKEQQPKKAYFAKKWPHLVW